MGLKWYISPVKTLSEMSLGWSTVEWQCCKQSKIRLRRWQEHRSHRAHLKNLGFYYNERKGQGFKQESNITEK